MLHSRTSRTSLHTSLQATSHEGLGNLVKKTIVERSTGGESGKTRKVQRGIETNIEFDECTSYCKRDVPVND